MKKGTILTIDDVKRLYKCLQTNRGKMVILLNYGEENYILLEK